MRPSRISTLLTAVVLVAAASLVGALPVAAQTIGTANVLILDLGTLGGANSSAVDVSPDGVVVGSSARPDGSSHAFTYDLIAGGPMVDLGVLPGATWSDALGITDAGVVMGESWSAAAGAAFAYDTAAASPQMEAVPLPAGAGAEPWIEPLVMKDARWLAGWWGVTSTTTPTTTGSSSTTPSTTSRPIRAGSARTTSSRA
jgi:probable HAF family extracellular repeat protein